jgi:phage shock protein PspC (stress-responsive transcriptional regulator)
VRGHSEIIEMRARRTEEGEVNYVPIEERSQKWVRSSNGWIAGVCQGLGVKFQLNPMLLRLAWVLSVLFFGVGLLIYIGLAICLPKEGYEQREAESDKVLGVCRRIAQRSQLDVGLVRFFCLLLAVTSLGATLVGYIVLHFVLDENSSGNGKNLF